MSTFAKFFRILQFITYKLSICANTGFTAGSIAGFFLELDYSFNNSFHLSSVQEVIIDSLILTGGAWLIILFVLCIIARYTFSSVALPALLNCFLTCYVTTFICNNYSLFPLGWVIGIVVGIVIGSILCKFNLILSKIKI